MRFLIITCVLLASASYSFACPNLTGKYQMDYEQQLRRYTEFQQNGCAELKLRTCFIQQNGSVNCDQSWITWNLDGQPHETCLQGNSCRVYSSDQTSVTAKEIAESFRTKTAAHGLCKYEEFNLSLDADKNLIDTTKVHDCQDGFSGLSAYTTKRLP